MLISSAGCSLQPEQHSGCRLHPHVMGRLMRPGATIEVVSLPTPRYMSSAALLGVLGMGLAGIMSNHAHFPGRVQPAAFWLQVAPSRHGPADAPRSDDRGRVTTGP